MDKTSYIGRPGAYCPCNGKVQFQTSDLFFLNYSSFDGFNWIQIFDFHTVPFGEASFLFDEVTGNRIYPVLSTEKPDFRGNMICSGKSPCS